MAAPDSTGLPAMNAPTPTFTDTLAPLVDADCQRQAAQLAQEVFAQAFQAALAPAPAADSLARLLQACQQWQQAPQTDSSAEAASLRLALLVSGLDQWGLAYSQAFGLTAIPPLSALLGALRTGLDAQADARFQQFFSQLEEEESSGIDFKIELRRQIHLALWHAMAACETEAAARPVLETLGSLMLALNTRMPLLGWRLMADAVAHFQIRLLADPQPGSQAVQGTQLLLAALEGALPRERYQAIQAHATQAVLAWQQARRPA